MRMTMTVTTTLAYGIDIQYTTKEEKKKEKKFPNWARMGRKRSHSVLWLKLADGGGSLSADRT